MASENGGLVLLDTHAWFWLASGEVDFAPQASQAIVEASSRDCLRVSVMSIWEIGMLDAKGRVDLGRPAEAWVRQALAMPGIALADLTPAIALASSRLPGEFHGDPADRIIVATARLTGAALVTRDRLILEYARAGHCVAVQL